MVRIHSGEKEASLIGKKPDGHVDRQRNGKRTIRESEQADMPLEIQKYLRLELLHELGEAAINSEESSN